MWKWETDKTAKGVVVIVHNILEHHGRYAWLIMQLRRRGYHVIMGDLPGQGQTSRVNRGHINSFGDYREAVLDWIDVAEEYYLPVFVVGVGLGGLIITNLLEHVTLRVEGVILISPLFGFQHTTTTRKNFFASSFGGTSKDAKFDLGIDYATLTRNEEAVAEIENDSLVLKQVSFHWYRSIIETMKETMEHLERIEPLAMQLHYGTEDQLIDLDQIKIFEREMACEAMEWEGYYHELHHEPENDKVLREMVRFMDKRIEHIGLIVK
ncbi:alpha/beta hydrolase [Macrococcus hajekii]|uniref:Alpha/beta hydrolase n=1 Tax=Macrococcus hajekii TaxID=198482 RepID=A0A4R6BLH5_9STAP|nr:alpha/beta hydrolase [Macrococcus hajekii]TDM02644.1 alpha/beta hydrolase [Macrococcus hajekii]GGB02718.1 lysophospholipase [Macrococcus hajekii]